MNAARFGRVAAPSNDEDETAATISEIDGVRYLHLGTPWVQGAMRIARPLEIELEYVQRMMAWMLWRPSDEIADGLAVQLGLGAGAITRFCHRKLRMRTLAVEINASVIAACRMWFRLPADDERLCVLHDDAARWVSAEVWHPQHGPATVRRYRALAARFDLIETGGSDYHGHPRGADLGSSPVPASALMRLKEAAGVSG